MCHGCLDFIDTLIKPIAITGRGSTQVECDHYPPCTHRALRSDEVEEWMRQAIPRTYTMTIWHRTQVR